MSGRIPPDRPGYTGYECSDETSSNHVPVYILECMCCKDENNLECEETFYNIPARVSISTDEAVWCSENNSYIIKRDAVPGTARHIWETTPDVTPPDCGDDMDPAYNYLETEYIDVPPIVTRGMSVAPGEQTPDRACPVCYSVKVDLDEHGLPYNRVYYIDSNDELVDAPVSDGTDPEGPPKGTVLPVQLGLYDVESKIRKACLGEETCCGISGDPGTKQIIFSYCPPVPIGCSDCFHTEKNAEGDVTGAYYLDNENNRVYADITADGNIYPTTAGIDFVEQDVADRCRQLEDDYKIGSPYSNTKVTQVTFSLCQSAPDLSKPMYPLCYSVRLDDNQNQVVYYLNEHNEEVRVTANEISGFIEPRFIHRSLVSPSIEDLAEAVNADYVLFTYCPPSPFICELCYKERIDNNGDLVVYWVEKGPIEHIVQKDNDGKYPFTVVNPAKLDYSMGENCPDPDDYIGEWTNKAYTSQVILAKCGSASSTGRATCTLCYRLDEDNKPVWRDTSGTHAAPFDDDGNVMPVTIPFESILEDDKTACGGTEKWGDTEYNLTWIYCSRAPVVCPACYEKEIESVLNTLAAYYIDGNEEKVYAERTLSDFRFMPTVVPYDEVGVVTQADCDALVESNYPDAEGWNPEVFVMFMDCPPIKSQCVACYEMEYSEDNPDRVMRYYYTDKNGEEQDAPIAVDGYAAPITLAIDEVDHNSYGCDTTQVTEITFMQCEPHLYPYIKEECDAAKYITMEDTGTGKSLRFNYESIPGFNASGKIGLVSDNGCLVWIPMDECP